MRLMLGLVRQGADREEIADLLTRSSEARLFAVGVLAAAALGTETTAIRQGGEGLELLGPAEDLQLTARVTSGDAVLGEFVQPVLQFDGQSYHALPVNGRGWLPVSVEALAELVDFAEHADSLSLLPPELRGSRIENCSTVVGVPQDVVVRFVALAGRDL